MEGSIRSPISDIINYAVTFVMHLMITPPAGYALRGLFTDILGSPKLRVLTRIRLLNLIDFAHLPGTTKLYYKLLNKNMFG